VLTGFEMINVAELSLGSVVVLSQFSDEFFIIAGQTLTVLLQGQDSTCLGLYLADISVELASDLETELSTLVLTAFFGNSTFTLS
jgi:hypothetical protein